jgi:hypothetical protein
MRTLDPVNVLITVSQNLIRSHEKYPLDIIKNPITAPRYTDNTYAHRSLINGRCSFTIPTPGSDLLRLCRTKVYQKSCRDRCSPKVGKTFTFIHTIRFDQYTFDYVSKIEKLFYVHQRSPDGVFSNRKSQNGCNF